LTGEWIEASILLGIDAIFNWRTEAYAFCINKGHRKLSDKACIKILTYNLNRAYSTSINKGTESEVADFIKAQDADIILLQEFNPHIYTQINKELRDAYPYGNIVSDESRFKSIYSRYSIKDYQQLTTASEVLPICSMKLYVNGEQILVYNCHLQTNNFSTVYKEMRESSIGILKGIKKIVTSIIQGYNMRQEQVKMILSQIDRIETPVIVCGDLNDVGGSKVIRYFKKEGFCDAWWQKGRGFGFSYWGLNMRFRLDHVLYKGNVQPTSIEVTKSPYSDHRTLVATFYVGTKN